MYEYKVMKVSPAGHVYRKSTIIRATHFPMSRGTSKGYFCTVMAFFFGSSTRLKHIEKDLCLDTDAVLMKIAI